MAAELTIALVIEKLQNLLATNQIEDPRFRNRVNHSITMLQDFQKIVDGPKVELDGCKIKLLQTVYFAEDTTDIFLVKTALPKQKAIIKAFSSIQFKLQSSRFRCSNNMRKAENQLRMLFNKLDLPTVSMSNSKAKSSENEQTAEATAQEFSSNLENVKDNKSFGVDASDKGKEIVEEVGDGIESIEPGPEISVESQDRRDASDYPDESTEVIGLNNERGQLSELITNFYDRCFLIAVVGVAGSGKTTLVRTVYQSHLGENFDCCAWISVSQFFRERDVLLRILEQVAEVKGEGELSLDVLRTKLRRILLQKRYLIVLDDVHQSNVWDRLKLSLPNSLTGSRVVLTVRKNIVEDFKPCVVLVHPLNEDESWKLFLKTVGKDITKPELINFKEKILLKCQGVPYRIRMLGGLLSTKDFTSDAWSKVIGQTIRSASSAISPAVSSDLPSALSSDLSSALSSDLSSPLRACLLYLCLFPKSSEISVRRLFLLWLAEGLLMTSAGKAPEDLMEDYLEQLEKRRMIDINKRRSDGRAKTCSVPSTLYDDLFPNAEKIGFFHIHGISDSTSKSLKYNIRRLAEHSDIKDNPPPEEYVQYLRSYISFNIRMGDKPTDEVGNFLKTTIIKGGYGLLTVLDLEGVYKPMLPEKLGKNLILLKHVGLRRTFLDLIPESVGDLLHLETLDVKYTNITTLPISIWKAKKLRHLYMDWIHFNIPIRSSFSRCSLAQLHTLSGLLIGNNNPPIGWLTGLTGLRKLGLTCHTEPLPEITMWICTKLVSLESLKLRAINARSEPSKLDLGSLRKHKNLRDLYLVGELPTSFNLRELPPNLKVLTLSVSKLSDDPMETLGELRELNILRLFADSFTGKEIACRRAGFPQLRVMKLWMLKELNKCTIHAGSMPLLREFEIRCCKELQKLEGLENLNKNNLRKLTLTNLEKHFVVEVKGIMGEIVKEEELNFNPSWD